VRGKIILGERKEGWTITEEGRSEGGREKELCSKAMAGVGEMIGEMIASAVVKQIVSKLNYLVTREVFLQWRFKDEVVKISSKMKDLEAVMHDADNKLRRGGTEGEAVRRWLAELKSVADDIDDVLEELHATELMKEIQPKVLLKSLVLHCCLRNKVLFVRFEYFKHEILCEISVLTDVVPPISLM
jgi:hypothetical protein